MSKKVLKDLLTVCPQFKKIENDLSKMKGEDMLRVYEINQSFDNVFLSLKHFQEQERNRKLYLINEEVFLDIFG